MKIFIDIIFLSYAKNDHLKNLTVQSINTLLESESPEKIQFNIVVIESNKSMAPFQFDNTITIYPKEEFGFNKFLNIGIRATNNAYVCLCNNDLIFHKNWATEILFAFDKDKELLSASPICSLNQKDGYPKINTGYHYGYTIAKEIAGWCIFIKRSLINKIGHFDEEFKFWYADNDYANILKGKKLNHALISHSIVDHLESKTINVNNEMVKYILTSGEYIYYDYKWNHKSKNIYFLRTLKFKYTIIFNRIKAMLKIYSSKQMIKWK